MLVCRMPHQVVGYHQRSFTMKMTLEGNRCFAATEPSGDAFAFALRGEHFMPESSSDKHDEATYLRCDVDKLLAGVVEVEPEMAAMLGLPIIVEVENGGDLACVGAFVLVEVQFVECAFGVDREMPFPEIEAKVESAIHGGTQVFEIAMIDGSRFGSVQWIEPQHAIGANGFADFQIIAPPHSRAFELAVLPQRFTFDQQCVESRAWQCVVDHTPAGFRKLIDDEFSNGKKDGLTAGSGVAGRR